MNLFVYNLCISVLIVDYKDVLGSDNIYPDE